MLTLTVQAANYAELVEKLRDLGEGFIPTDVAIKSGNTKVALPPTTEAEPERAEGRKRGRPAKVVQADAAPSEEPAPAPVELVASAPAPAPAAAPAKAVTADDVKSALTKLAEQRPGDTDHTDGWQRVTNLLAAFGYRKVKEIPEIDFAKVVAAAERAVAHG